MNTNGRFIRYMRANRAEVWTTNVRTMSHNAARRSGSLQPIQLAQASRKTQKNSQVDWKNGSAWLKAASNSACRTSAGICSSKAAW